MKNNIIMPIIIILLLTAMILSGCGGGTSSNITSPSASATEPSTVIAEPTTPEPEPYINILSTANVSVLSVYSYYYSGSKKIRYDTTYTLDDTEKIFFLVTLWTKPSINTININLKDIAVVGGDSERSTVVGIRVSGDLWDYVFAIGDANMTFTSSSLIMTNCEFKYSTPNAYGISCDGFPMTEGTIGSWKIPATTSGITFAFVVSKVNTTSGSLWLQVPNSPLIQLTGSKNATPPAITPLPNTTTTTTSTPSKTSSPTTSPSTTTYPTTTYTPTTLPTTFNPTSIPTSTEPGFSKEHPLPMGESLITAEGYEITVLEAIKGEQAWSIIKNASQNNLPPDAGMQYVIIKVRVKNISDKLGIGIAYLNLRLIDSANILHNTYDKWVTLPDGGSYYEPWNKLNIGDEVTGRVSFEMPVGENNPVLLWGLIESYFRFFEVKASDSGTTAPTTKSITTSTPMLVRVDDNFR